jgi:hypothetical protein
MSEINLQIRRLIGEIPSNEGVRAYAAAMVETREALGDVELAVAQLSMGYLAYNIQRQLDELESRQTELVSHIDEFERAARDGNLSIVSLLEEDLATPTNDSALQDFVADGMFENLLNDLHERSARLEQRLLTKRQSANARLGLVISLTALLVSLGIFSISVARLI